MTTEIINNSVSNQILEDKDRNEASECFENSLNPMKEENGSNRGSNEGRKRKMFGSKKISSSSIKNTKCK